MIQLSRENELAKRIHAVLPCELYYDKDRFTLFAYADGASKEQVKRIKNIFLNYIDLNNLQEAYKTLTVYS